MDLKGHTVSRDANDLLRVLRTVAWWQKWEIEPAVFTPGLNDVAWILANIQFPADITGARVLDIGGWNGCFSFECERRGASEVVMVEPTPVASTGFEITKAYLDSKVKRVDGTIYDLDPDKLGHFDIVLCLGVIYHLRYPLLGLDNIRRVCKRDLYVESACLEEAFCAPAPTGAVPLDKLGPHLKDLSIVQFSKENLYFNDTTNWFIPNRTAADAMLESAGFAVTHSLATRRYFAKATVKPGEPPLFKEAHEGLDYELHARHLLGDRARWAMPS